MTKQVGQQPVGSGMGATPNGGASYGTQWESRAYDQALARLTDVQRIRSRHPGLLELIAFFPQGIDENNIDRLFPAISNQTTILNTFFPELRDQWIHHNACAAPRLPSSPGSDVVSASLRNQGSLLHLDGYRIRRWPAWARGIAMDHVGGPKC